MKIILLLIAVIFSVYGFIFLGILVGWLKVLLYYKPKNNVSQNFSIIIPFRNEEINIEKLVMSLTNLDYSYEKFEIIFINDHSQDNSVGILENVLEGSDLNFKILHLGKEHIGKKKAILQGIDNAKYPNIITTDADCTHNKNWINSINRSFQKEYDFIIGPVISNTFSILSGLQSIESIQLAGITIGSAAIGLPLICSGANLAFTKKCFLKLAPFQDNLDVLSGDDMFFLEKIKNSKEFKIGVNLDREGFVFTEPDKSMAELVNRSIRWGGKLSRLKDNFLTFFGGIVLISNYSLLLLLAMCFFFFENSNIFLKLVSLKIGVDLLLFFIVSIYYKQLKSIVYLPLMVCFYPLFLVIIVIPMLIKKPKWKNR